MNITKNISEWIPVFNSKHIFYIIENCAVICARGLFSSFWKKSIFRSSRNSFDKNRMHYAQSRQIKKGLLRPNMLTTRANLVALFSSWIKKTFKPVQTHGEKILELFFHWSVLLTSFGEVRDWQIEEGETRKGKR